MTMHTSYLTCAAFSINGAAGSGKYDDISIDDVKRAIGDGTVFEFLKTRLGHDVDLSLLEPSHRKELLEEWQFLATDVDEGRKFFVDRGGLCLLVAYLLESIQRRARDSS